VLGILLLHQCHHVFDLVLKKKTFVSVWKALECILVIQVRFFNENT